MKCLHFSVPSTSAIHEAVALLSPASSGNQSSMDSPDHLNCHELLTEVARNLENPGTSVQQRANSLQAAEVIIEELAHDQRVQENLPTEYFGIRFLQAEARSARDEYRTSGDTTGFERFRNKLESGLFPRNRNSPRQSAPKADIKTAFPFESQSLAAEAGRLAMFVVLLVAAVAGVVFTGMFVMGTGY